MKEVSNEFIPVAGPSITAREVALVAEAAEKAWYADHYAYNRRFEETFARYIGVKHAVSLPHCTAAIHLSVAALGIGPGDEVIVPDVTWIASVAPVVYVGATPVFVDILPDTWCIDPDAVERAIGPRTKGIIGVDLYGSMCDWDKLKAIASRHKLALIEDSAEALGSSYRGRMAGALGATGVYSFHGSKTVATGEGGMLVTDDDALHTKVQMLRDHGRPPGDRFFLNEVVGFKYKMNAVTAALGLAQMERIDELIAHKRDIFRWYKDRLGGLNGVAINTEPDGVRNSFWMVSAIPEDDYGLDKFAIMAGMKERNIDTRPFFSPLSTLNAFAEAPQSKRYVDADRDQGYRIAKTGVNLPSGYNMTEGKVDIVCRAFREVLDTAPGRKARA
jgi:perosamine synthetase